MADPLFRFVMRTDGFWDRYVFRKIRDTLGGNIRIVFSGSAPLSPTILTFVRCVLGCIVKYDSHIQRERSNINEKSKKKAH